jgi:ferrochelatase
MTRTDDVLLVGHGTLEDLDDLPAFLSNIRRGRPTPPELVAEVRRRYQAIGGKSPLLEISRMQAAALAEKLGRKVHLAMRLWHPYASDVVRELVAKGVRELSVVALAPYSAGIYAGDVARFLSEQRATGVAVPLLRGAPNWGLAPSLVRGFVEALTASLARLPPERRAAAHVLFTAHSLPVAVLRQGDPYETEVLATARAVASEAGLANPHRVAFQSQGMTQDPWLGPDLRSSFAAIAAAGARDLVVCPIGFLTDHIEILYDLDIEAAALARELGLSFTRTESLNASATLVTALAEAVGMASPLPIS